MSGALDGPGTAIGSSPEELRPAADQVDQPAEHTLADGAQAVVLEFIGLPGPKAADGRGRLLREVAVHVQVVDVDRGGDRDLVVAQPVGVVEGRPWMLSSSRLC